VLDPDAAETTRKTNRWWLRKPLLIITLAGLVHLVRGAEVDGFIFLGTATALAVAEVRDPVGHRTLRLPLAVAITAVPLGWVISMLPPATAGIAVAVAVFGPPMLYLALTAPNAPATGLRWWPWALVGALVCLWELSQFLQQPDLATDSFGHPTLSVIVGPLFADGPPAARGGHQAAPGHGPRHTHLVVGRVALPGIGGLIFPVHEARVH
jgi:hypothetical protein